MPPGGHAPPVPVLSEAELARQQAALDAAYAIFIDIKNKHPDTVTAVQARGEILVAVQHWRESPMGARRLARPALPE